MLAGQREGAWGRASILSVMPNAAPHIYWINVVSYWFLKVSLQCSVFVHPMSIAFSFKYIFKEWFEQDRLCLGGSQNDRASGIKSSEG